MRKKPSERLLGTRQRACDGALYRAHAPTRATSPTDADSRQKSSNNAAKRRRRKALDAAFSELLKTKEIEKNG